jgi:hypothetical protein
LDAPGLAGTAEHDGTPNVWETPTCKSRSNKREQYYVTMLEWLT